MTTTVEPADKPHPNFQVRTMVATPLPQETTYPLSEDEYLTLKDGDTSNAMSGLFLFIGLFVSAVIGLFSLWQNADWNSFWTHQRTSLIVYFAVLLFVAGGSFVGGGICIRLLCKEDGPCSRLRAKIENYFNPVILPEESPPPAEAPHP